jgi:transposase
LTRSKKAVAGTLTSHDVPEADATQPAKHARLVFFDATDLHWCPDVGNSYVPQGDQRVVDSPGVENPWYALLGSLEYPTGEGLYTIHQRKRHEEVQAHLERLLARDSDAFWIVVLDNASAHTTPKLEAFLTQHRGCLRLVFQPTYSPHLNLIERLWRLMRGQMTRNQFYQSLKELAEAVVEWLEKLSFATFCSLIGIDEQSLVLVE